jgi:UDP-N-acetylglucosamine 2-epimerase (non-hydrolysing)
MDQVPDKVHAIDPLGYFDILRLMRYAKKILTDSGGIQKEAYILGVPCITLRENTEWVETLEDGGNVLAGADREKILSAHQKKNPLTGYNPVFGTGNTAEQIAGVIDSFGNKK